MKYIVCGSGMIAKPLIRLLLKKGHEVTALTNNPQEIPEELSQKIELIEIDLFERNECFKHIRDADCVLNLAGRKGSAREAVKKSAEFLYTNAIIGLNVIDACRRNNIKDYLFTSSVAVYDTSDECKESAMIWDTIPSFNDIYGGYAKRIGELAVDAYNNQFDMNCHIVRPSNVYGKHDNFEEGAMVIPALIKKAHDAANNKQKYFDVIGDGTPMRSITYAKDVARAIYFIHKNDIQGPHGAVNIVGGVYSIKEIAEEIADYFGIRPRFTGKSIGDNYRIMEGKILQKNGFRYKTHLAEGIEKTIDYYKQVTP